jgi:hypothetical protein
MGGGIVMKVMYDIHPHERLCMRERLGNELPFPRHCLSKPLFSSFFIHSPFLGFDFYLLSPFLGMHLLHRTWVDGLLARRQSSCFLFFLGS